MSQWEITPTGTSQRGDEAVYVRPDVVLVEQEDGEIEIRLPQAKTFNLHVNSMFADLAGSRTARKQMDDDEYYCVRDCVDHARLFIRGMQQRWITLRLIAYALVREQEAFIRQGPRAIRPLTRAYLADRLNLHESIVSRAVAGKFVQLPDNSVIPMSSFFDDSLAVKDVIREIVEGEMQPLSDQQMADELSSRGYQVARRTVAKYRDALGILPAALRFKGHLASGSNGGPQHGVPLGA
jgi:RNA polymerase sigma-54 factor